MSIVLRRLLAGTVLAIVLPGAWCAPSAEHEAAALFGLEYDEPASLESTFPGSVSCIELERRPLRMDGADQADWQAGTARCGERVVELLKRRIAEREDGVPRWRIEDVLLLPASVGSDARRLARQGECALRGASDTSFVALLRRRGGRTPAVDQVWTYDLEQGKLQQQGAGRVSCTVLTD